MIAFTGPLSDGAKAVSIAPVAASKATMPVWVTSVPPPGGWMAEKSPPRTISEPTEAMASTEPFSTCGVAVDGTAETTVGPGVAGNWVPGGLPPGGSTLAEAEPGRTWQQRGGHCHAERAGQRPGPQRSAAPPTSRRAVSLVTLVRLAVVLVMHPEQHAVFPPTQAGGHDGDAPVRRLAQRRDPVSAE